MDRSKGGLSSLVLAALLVGGRWLSGTAVAQSTDVAHEQREKQYQELVAEVDHLERQSMALRKVVHFVNPAVVHIDA